MLMEVNARTVLADAERIFGIRFPSREVPDELATMAFSLSGTYLRDSIVRIIFQRVRRFQELLAIGSPETPADEVECMRDVVDAHSAVATAIRDLFRTTN